MTEKAHAFFFRCSALSTLGRFLADCEKRIAVALNAINMHQVSAVNGTTQYIFAPTLQVSYIAVKNIFLHRDGMFGYVELTRASDGSSERIGEAKTMRLSVPLLSPPFFIMRWRVDCIEADISLI